MRVDDLAETDAGDRTDKEMLFRIATASSTLMAALGYGILVYLLLGNRL